MRQITNPVRVLIGSILGLSIIVCGGVLFTNLSNFSGMSYPKTATWHGNDRILGQVSEIKGAMIRGWALNPRRQMIPLAVSLHIDGTAIATVAANGVNSAFTEAVCSSCRAGFEFTIPQVYFDGRAHQLDVYGLDSNLPEAVKFHSSSMTFGGSSNAMNFVGTDMSETINGSPQNDTLSGMGGDDTIYGGDGNDTYLYSSGHGRDVLIDASGQNTLQCSGIQGQCFPLNSGAVLLFPDGGWIRLMHGITNLNISSCAPQNTSCADPHSRPFTIVLDDAANTSTAPDTNDGIQGLGGDDTIAGMGGDDYIHGNAGNDIINGNMGNDIIRGGQGDDVLYGGKDNDILYGDLGNDRLSGDLGDDTFYYREGDGDDVIEDLSGSNQLVCLGVQGTASNENSNLVIRFASGGTITLVGGTASTTNASGCVQK